MSDLPESVVITDDTMREGLQMESAGIQVSEKLRLLDALKQLERAYTGTCQLCLFSFSLL
jgi:hypothetical protein